MPNHLAYILLCCSTFGVDFESDFIVLHYYCRTRLELIWIRLHHDGMHYADVVPFFGGGVLLGSESAGVWFPCLLKGSPCQF